MAEETPASPDSKTKPTESLIPKEFLKKPDPKAVEAVVQKRVTDDIDVDDFVYDVDRELKLLGDKSQIDTAVQEAIRSYSRARELDPADFEKQMRSQAVNPLKIASELSKGTQPLEVAEGLKARTLAGTTKAQREVAARGETIFELGRQRAQAKIGRTVEKTGEVPVELLFDKSESKFDETDTAGLFGSDIEDVEKAVQVGDALHGELKQINSMIENLAAEGDERAKSMVELREKYSSEEQGAERYALERAANMVKSLGIRKPEGFDENQRKALILEGKFDELAKVKAQAQRHEAAFSKAREQALKEIATWKTLGLWTAPTFVRYLSDEALTSDPDRDISLGEALAPTVEIVGLDRNSNVITRSQGAMQWGFEINDILNSAIVGALDEEGASLGQRMLRGVAKRRNTFELALDSDIAQTSTGAKVGLGVVGFAAAVLTPDLTFGTAALYKRMNVSLTKLMRKKDLIKLADDHEEAAQFFAEALASGDREMLKEAADLGKALRDKAGVSMDRVDISDFDAARRLGRENPDILATKQGNELADSLPGRLGDERMNLHPSVIRRQSRIGMEDGKLSTKGPQEAAGTAYKESYNFNEMLDEVDAMRALINAEDGAVYERFVSKVMTGTISRGSTVMGMLTKVDKLSPERGEALVRIMLDNKALARDPEAWSKAAEQSVREALEGTGEAGTKILNEFIGDEDNVGFINTAKAAAQAAIDDAGDFEVMGKLVDRAEEAIKTNIESRAIAHALDRSLIHGELGVKSSPVIAESVAKVKELTELSDDAISFMDDAVKTFGVTKDEAMEAARIFDLAAIRWSNRTQQDPTKWWQTRLKGFETKDDFAKKFYTEDVASVLRNIRHPSLRYQSVLPPGLRIVGEGELNRPVFMGVPEDVRDKLIELLGDKVHGLSDEALMLIDGLKPKGLFKRKARYDGDVYGAYEVNLSVLNDLVGPMASRTLDPSVKLKEALDELEKLGLFGYQHEKYAILDDRTGEILARTAYPEEIPEIVEDVITRPKYRDLMEDGDFDVNADIADTIIGHDVRVGPIIKGMDIDAVDASIAGHPFEYAAGWINGVSVFRKRGSTFKVPFTDGEIQELSLGARTQITHNHPNYSWFSTGKGDLSLAAGNNINEMRVVWPDGTVISVEAPNGWGKLAHFTHRNADGDLAVLDEVDPNGILKNITAEESLKELVSFRRKVSQIDRYAKVKADEALKGREADPGYAKSWALAYTEEANKRLRVISESFEVDIRISIRSPEESFAAGRSRARLAPDILRSEAGREFVEATGDGAEVFFQGVQRQPGVEFRELSDGLVELTTQAVRDAGGEGLTFRVVDGRLSIDSVSIPAELQGRGIGADLYRNALSYARERGFAFASDISPSRDAVAVYERLIAEGAPLTRKLVRAPDGAMVRQYVAEADELSSPNVLRQTEAGTGSAKGATEFLEDGRAIIYALEQPDFTTLVHEMGHILRRDLGVEDFEKVGGWVQSLGAKVEMRAGRFIGEPEEVRKAEEFFAEAFEQYIKEGEPPVEELRSSFERMKDYMVQAVTYLLPNAKVTPEMRQVFDDLLVTAKPEEPLLPRVTRMVRTTLLGKDQGGEFDTIRAISDEALRLGIDNADYDTLLKQLEDTGKIQLEGKIFADRFPDVDDAVGGVDEFSSADLADLRRAFQAEIETKKIMDQEVGLGAATTAFSQVIREKSPSEKIDALLRGNGAKAHIGAIVKSSFIGGNITEAKQLSALPPTVRARVETATRMVKQGTAEGIRLVGEATDEAGYKNLIDFLTGENVAYATGGRRVLTSGHDSASSVFTQITKYIEDQAKQSDDIADLIALAQHKADGKTLKSFSLGARKDPKTDRRFTKANAEEAWNRLFKGASSPKFLEDFLLSIAPVTAKGGNATPKDWYDLTEILMYHVGATTRNGKKFTGDVKTQMDSFLSDVENLYDRASSMRAAILFATYGHAERAQKLWSGLGLAVDQNAFTSFQKWLLGQDIPAADIPKVKRMVKRFGMRPDFVEVSLLGTSFYVPKAARERLAEALVRGVDPDVSKGVLSSEDDIKGIHGVLLRYNKLRMTRGGIALRQRYFLMNTIDHFAQMAMINGLRPAVGSTLRVLAQDVMVLPGVARTVDILTRVGRLEPAQAEKIRERLQRGGDTLAKLFSASKYNINVNPILEGRDGFFRVGGNMYSYKELRDIAVEEGIFASFDTTQLSNSVQRAGRAAISRQSDDMSTYRRAQSAIDYHADKTTEALTQVISDTAEAWGERERLGAMVSLMETGLAPRVAARLTIDALYDYAGSMTKADRNWLVSLILPFWAFQKNANRQFLDTLFSPSGVYRMGVLRRGTELTADALTEIMWSSVSDEYGVDTRALESAEPELFQDYMLLKKNIRDHYDGVIPEDVRIGMNMWLRGESQRIFDGERYLFSGDAAPTEESLGGVTRRYIEFVRPLPSQGGRASYLRDRAGVLIPFSLAEEETRKYYNAIRDSKMDHSYTEVFFPDSTINAGMRHMANMAAFYVMGLMKTKDFFDDLRAGENVNVGLDEVSMMRMISEVADPERAPVIGDTVRVISENPGYPRRVHPHLRELFDVTFPGTRMLELDAKEDIYGERDAREGVEFEERRSYMFPGAWSLIFDNTLGEINNVLYDMDPIIGGSGRMSPAEKTALRGKLLQAARSVVGLQTAQFAPDQTAQRERRVRKVETDKPETR